MLSLSHPSELSMSALSFIVRFNDDNHTFSLVPSIRVGDNDSSSISSGEDLWIPSLVETGVECRIVEYLLLEEG